MNLGKIIRGAVRYAKQNPEKVLVVASLVAPAATAKVVAKVAPLIVAAKEPS